MRSELASTVRNVTFHGGPDLDTPEGCFSRGMTVEVLERNGPSGTICVREQDGDRQGWVTERSLRLQ